ncbi:hypothetical protein GO287_04995 [Ralstonia solanacearum]|nr:hypothetical protein [Ralstonia solanacearum]NKG08104.1 hypothetical protein [Ralstonia solanacearum]
MPLADRHQIAVQGRRDAQRHGRAPMAGGGRACPVGREGAQLGRAGERLAPVGELASGAACRIVGPGQQRVLPDGVVHVLDRQRRPGGRASAAPRGIGDGQIGHQRADRFAVGGDVVQQEQQHVLVGAEREQRGAQRKLRGEIEAVPDGRLQRIVQRRLGLGPVVQAHAFQRGPGVRCVQYPLARRLPCLREDRAQALVARDHIGERGFERIGMQRAAQAPARGHVVGRARPFEAMQEPQALLRKRQGNGIGARHRRQHRAFDGARLAGRHPLREQGDGGRLEQRAHRQFDAQHRADAAGQPRGQQRMPAEIEEAVVDPDLLQPQRVGEQGGQRMLHGRAWRAGGRLRREVRRGQRLAIDLAVGGERQRLEHDDGGGHHIVGQVLGQITAQCRRLRLRVLCGNDIADQLPIARLILACDHGGLGHLGMLLQHGLHLTRLDAEAADLDLLVDAAEELDGAVMAPAAQVAGAIEPRAGRAERIGDKALGGQAGAVEVAARDAGATDAEFARRADRHGLQHRIEQVDLRVVQRAAERHVFRHVALGRHRIRDGVGRGLRGAVDVHDRRVRAARAHALECRCRSALAAGPQRAQPAQAGGVGVHRQPEHRGRHEDGGHARRVDQLPQRGWLQVARRRRDDLPTRQQRHPQFIGRRIERMRRMRQHARVVAVAPAPVGGEAGNVGVRDGHPLGAAGRARGVDHVGQLVRGDRAARVGGGLPRQRGIVEVDHAARHAAQALRCLALDQQHAGGGIGHDPLLALIGVAGRQRRVHRARLEHGGDGDDEIGRIVQQHGDAVFGPHAESDEVMREPVGAGVQVGIGEAAVAADDGDGLGIARDLLLEQRRDRPVRHRLRGRIPALQQALVLVVQQVDLADAAPGYGDDGFEHPLPLPHQARDGRCVEQVDGVFDVAVQAGRRVPRIGRIGRFPHVEDQVAFHDRHVHRQVRGPQAGQVQPRLLPRVLQAEHDLEQRMRRQRAGRVERFDHALERQVLVCVGGQAALAHLAQQRGDVGIARRIGPQRQRVDEEADQRIERGIGAPGDGRADDDVGAGAQAAEQDGERRVQHHEEAGAVPLAGHHQRAVQRGRHVQPEGGVAMAGDGGPGPVRERRAQLGRARQRPVPVGELAPGMACRIIGPGQQRMLPEGVVRILER